MNELEKARKEAGLNQTQMGKLLGMAQHRISELEKGTDGRALTQQHKASIKMVLELHRTGLLSDFLQEI